MIPPDKLRALLADHAPRAYYDREQGAIRDVWDAAREMLAAWERGETCRVAADPWERFGVIHVDEKLTGSNVRIIPED